MKDEVRPSTNAYPEELVSIKQHTRNRHQESELCQGTKLDQLLQSKKIQNTQQNQGTKYKTQRKYTNYKIQMEEIAKHKIPIQKEIQSASTKDNK